MMRASITSLAIIAAGGLWTSTPICAGVVTFDNSCADGDWHTCCSIGGGNFENNWDFGPGISCPLPLPGANDDVDLGSNPVVLNQDTAEVNSLISNDVFTINGSALTLTQGAVLDEFNLLSSNLTAGGSITVNGPMNWVGGATGSAINHLGGPPVFTQFLGGFTLSGTGGTLSGRQAVSTQDALWLDGNFSLTNGASFDNQATFTIECDKLVQGNDGTLINSGSLIKKTTTGQTRVFMDFESAGQVDVQTGTLLLEGSGFSSGPFSIAANALLRINPIGSATFTLQDGTSFTGAGLGQGFARFTGNKCIIPAGVSVPATNFEVASGTLVGPGSLTAQLFKWTGGAIDGADVAALQVLDIDGFLSKTLTSSNVGPATLTNFFGATWKGTGDIILSTVGGSTNGVTLINEQDAVFDIKNDERITGSGTFINHGIVQKSEGTQTTTFDGIHYQNGAAAGGRGAGGAVKTEVQTGTLLIDGPGENAVDATFHVNSNATLTFVPQGNETFVMHGDGDTITGDGQVIKFGSGVLNVPDMNHFGANNFWMAAGTLSGPGRFTAANVEWTGGTLLDLDPVANPGDPQNPFLSAATESLNINGFLNKTLSSGTFVNEMDGTWSDIGFWNFVDAVFVNQGTFAAMDLHPSQNLRAFFASGVSKFENNGSMTCTGDAVEFSVTNGSGTFVNNNTLNNTADALNFGPGVALDNNGTIDVQAGELIIRGGGTNTGTFNLSGGQMFFRANPYDLHVGTQILGPGSAIVENVVRILGFSQADVIEIFGSGGAIEGMGDLDIKQSMLWANGAMRGMGSTVITPSATLAILGTSIKTLDQRLLDVRGSAFYGGTGDLLLQSSGEIAVNGLFEADTSGDITQNQNPNGVVTVNPGGTFNTVSPLNVTAFVTFNNQGTVNVGPGAALTLGGGGDFTNGTVNILGVSTTGLDVLKFNTLFPWTFNNTEVFGPGELLAGSMSVINVTGDSRVDNLDLVGTIDGPADLFVLDNLIWDGGGTMKGSGSTTATGQMTIKFANLDGRTFNNNALAVWPGSTITTSSNGVFNNINSLDIQDGFGWAVGPGGGTINNTGQFIRTTNLTGTTNIAPTFNLIAGKVQSQLGDLCFTGAFNQSGGIIQTNLSGTLSFTGPGGLNKTGGRIRGSGTIVGNVNLNGGSINPGDSPGTLDIDGDFTIATNGLIDLELAGLDPGTEHDVVDVTGTAALSGTLRLLPINGFVPQVGDSFIVLTAGGVAGTFDAVVGPGEYTMVYNSDNVVATVTTAPACSDLYLTDLNYDCAVNLDDYAILAGCHAGPEDTSPPAGCSTADFVTSDLDVDGDMDLADFGQFQILFAGP